MPNTNPSSASPSRSPSPPQQNDQPQHDKEPQQQQHRLQVHTHHCRFCNHLLLATTRTIATLPRRKPPAQDNALILPLPHDEDDEEVDADADAATHETNPPQNQNQTSETEGETETQEQGQGKKGKRKQKHTTILLSTTLPDRKPTLIRREDGFEKRRFVRCGRCRVVVGYFLDAVHFPIPGTITQNGREDGGEGEGIEQEPRVVYLLPGALIETEDMGDEEKMGVMDREWSGWIS
ncbi:hypothetical protein CNMCM5793_001542 [Aspergillus hiratsukae]|uniref:STEEP1 domain-containing protein n=1 Tax=Aspergillus hiratsukae TaxID=1194566 RepID=A0A8H6UEP9_9EURO|nr:hypothetical protein CNMCM5793_001542 [Aspergillus hiratsukae]